MKKCELFVALVGCLFFDWVHNMVGVHKGKCDVLLYCGSLTRTRMASLNLRMSNMILSVIFFGE